MRQFTKDEARAIRESRVWLKWTDNQILRLQLFQNELCMPFGTFHCALERCLGRPVYTHTVEFQKSRLTKEFLGQNEPPTFDELVRLLPADIIKHRSVELGMDRILYKYSAQA